MRRDERQFLSIGLILIGVILIGVILNKQRRQNFLLSALFALGILRTANAQTVSPTRPDTIAALHIFFIGDAGGAQPNPVLTALNRELRNQSAPSYVVFLGDNVYPVGIPPATDRTRANAETRLNAQIEAVRSTNARAIFVPGNHDWGKVDVTDNAQVIRQAEMIAAVADERIVMRPNFGCPGPEVVDIAAQVRIIVLDTEWWLRESNARMVDKRCLVNERAVLDSLARVITNSPVDRVIVVGHHPLKSVGPHAGLYRLRDHLFPFHGRKTGWIPVPVGGSIWLAVRSLLKSPQDLKAPRYKRFRTQIDSLFQIHHPFIYASGHEHNLEIFRSTGAELLLISGGGGEPPRSVSNGNNVLMAKQANGFMRLDLFDNRHSRLTVLSVSRNAETSVLFSTGINR